MIAPRNKPALQPARSADIIRSNVWSALSYEVALRALDLDSISVAVHGRAVLIEGYVAREKNRQLIQALACEAWKPPYPYRAGQIR